MISQPYVHTNVCLVAILKDEEGFLDEWLVYHRMIGIDHFFLYDNDPAEPLPELVSPHSSYVTVINWSQDGPALKMNPQMSAYKHALKNYIKHFKWVIFLDGDEFITIEGRQTIPQLLSTYEEETAISLRTYFFGHNGYWDDPKMLVTSALLRRQHNLSTQVKTFTRTSHIQAIKQSHFCELKSGTRICIPSGKKIDAKFTVNGYIYHYHCRSFNRWMRRADRGDAFYHVNACSEKAIWKMSYDGCLRKFVETVSLHNEQYDDFMLFYQEILERLVSGVREQRQVMPIIETDRLKSK